MTWDKTEVQFYITAIRYVTIRLISIYCHKIGYKNFPVYVLLSSIDITTPVWRDAFSSNLEFVSISEKIKWLISIWKLIVTAFLFCNAMSEKIFHSFLYLSVWFYHHIQRQVHCVYFGVFVSSYAHPASSWMPEWPGPTLLPKQILHMLYSLYHYIHHGQRKIL